MTIEKLLDNSIEQLEAMSDETLYRFCEPFFRVTRPSMIEKEKIATVTRTTERKRKPNTADVLAEAQRELARLGIKV